MMEACEKPQPRVVSLETRRSTISVIGLDTSAAYPRLVLHRGATLSSVWTLIR